jgi:prolipoprotein diacylglyceryltransferase
MDVLIVPVALGLAMGRVGNVINQELFASLLAQVLAVAKNLFVAAICYWHLRFSKSGYGGTTALFLVSYGLLRIAIETVRLQDYPVVWGFSLGQLYTVPFIIVGVLLGVYVKNKYGAKSGVT